MNKRKKFILSKWKPSLDEMIVKVIKKHSSTVTEQVLRSNILLRKLRHEH